MKSPFERYDDLYPLIKFKIGEIVGFDFPFIEDLTQDTFILSEERFHVLKGQNKLIGDDFIGMILKVARDTSITFIKKNRVNFREGIENEFCQERLEEKVMTEDDIKQQSEIYDKIDEIYKIADLLEIDKEHFFEQLASFTFFYDNNPSLYKQVSALKDAVDLFHSDKRCITERGIKFKSFRVRAGSTSIFPTKSFKSLEEALAYRNEEMIKHIKTKLKDA